MNHNKDIRQAAPTSQCCSESGQCLVMEVNNLIIKLLQITIVFTTESVLLHILHLDCKLLRSVCYKLHHLCKETQRLCWYFYKEAGYDLLDTHWLETETLARQEMRPTNSEVFVLNSLRKATEILKFSWLSEGLSEIRRMIQFIWILKV